MTVDQWVAVFSALVSFVGLLLVVYQLRDATAQRRLESLLQISAINREIITLGFSKPELFQILQGKQTDPLIEQHYLQLWFNQFELIHSFQDRRMFNADVMESLSRDIKDFMSEANARRHWQRMREFYPKSFQSFVNQITEKKTGAPKERPSRNRRFKRS
jgi:hypothetical protein